ncbi:unnamed protein product, partial [Choristocarpus tenellus]
MGNVLPRWGTGVAINILGSIAINFGTNLMKLSHKGSSSASVLGDRGVDSSGLAGGRGSSSKLKAKMTWRGGALTLLLGSLINFVSLSFAPQ